jgi:nucleoside-diphosphate-sugar epimerase
MKPNPFTLSHCSLDLLVRQNISKQKFVILGASGWLGRTLACLANRAGIELLLIGSSSRKIEINGLTFSIHEYDIDVIQQFSPTSVIDFAFITREHLRSMHERDFRTRNEKLINQALSVFALPSVKNGMFSSSGAAVYPKDALLGDYSENPYGYLKRTTEVLVNNASYKLGKRSIVIRPWSLSGTLNIKQHEYAFSDFIKQSFSEKISVNSTNPVLRRYVSAEDFLALALYKLFSNATMFESFDSGGEITSLMALAEKIALMQNHEVAVVAHQSNSNRSDMYFSDNTQWTSECEAAGFVPETLEGQIQRNINYFRIERGR